MSFIQLSWVRGEEFFHSRRIAHQAESEVKATTLRCQSRPKGNPKEDLQHSQKRRYKSCHWGCTFSKGTLFYPKATYWYLSGTY